jgi:hypothetical protein
MTTRQSHKRRGKTFETDILKWLRDRGYKAERLALAGAKDEGDVVVINDDFYVVLEAKAPGEDGKTNLAGWLREAETEAANFADARGISKESVQYLVVIKARGKGIDQAYTVSRLGIEFPEVPTINLKGLLDV